jgi:tripartite-type tricarboxylate transporter receptor subunit TctC
LVLLSAWALITPALAQTYPERAVKIIVSQPPGGGFDTVARVLADRLSPLLGQPLLVENRPGAGHAGRYRGGGQGAPRWLHPAVGGAVQHCPEPGLYDKLS